MGAVHGVERGGRLKSDFGGKCGLLSALGGTGNDHGGKDTDHGGKGKVHGRKGKDHGICVGNKVGDEFGGDIGHKVGIDVESRVTLMMGT